jgi:hypothetical protein
VDLETPTPLLTNEDISGMVVRLALTGIEVSKGNEAAEAQIAEFFDTPEQFDDADKAVYQLGYAHGMRELLTLIAGYLKERI